MSEPTTEQVLSCSAERKQQHHSFLGETPSTKDIDSAFEPTRSKEE
jgi:hypothetical protein